MYDFGNPVDMVMLAIIFGAGMFTTAVIGYAQGYREGRREGYTYGRSLGRNLVTIAELSKKKEEPK